MHPTPTPPASSPATVPQWQREWQDSFRNTGELLEFLGLEPHSVAELPDLDPRFPLLVPRSYAERMRKRDWNDPLLKQVLATRHEEQERTGFIADAVGDLAAEEVPGVLRKYHGRTLLVLTGICAVHCRYCFRREFPYDELPMTRSKWNGVYVRLKADPSVEEILFSGGDPLSLSDANLRWHWEQAIAIPQIKRLRIHTRLPVVLPSRLDENFLGMVSELSKFKPVYLVIHANHANEISKEVVSRLKALRDSGAVVLNQSVLLRGVNDHADALVELSERLLDAGALPYYLHQLDRVRGAWHFEVPEETGLKLMEDLRKRLPGYGVPKYVREIAGAASKTELIRK
ncbi:MAG TPA: EF-P beta-lysylation protein EpmB [Fibrobacteres bacterium]|jgi:EF-P beta-lysylation protein EpmB|nr:EF-P beta-lysylation protein EpmB [Fibrobacterota bacterium]